MSLEDGSYTYYYDSQGRLSKYEVEAGGIQQTVICKYDALGRVVTQRETAQVGTAVSEIEYAYAYGNRGKVVQVQAGLAIQRYIYDPSDRLKSYTTTHNHLGTDEESSVKTDTFDYTDDSNNVNQIGIHTIEYGDETSKQYSYMYDNWGNIRSISLNGTPIISYEYDTAGQLIRENNSQTGRTYLWTYDESGNILSRKEYTYTTAATSSLTGGTTVTYTYGNSNWGDLLTQYGNQDITYDAIGNMLSDEEWRYTWEHGRQLARMSDYNNDDYGWEFTYDAGGMRTQRSNGSTTYKYVYNGSQLTRMQVGGVTMQFVYSAAGTPLALIYNGHYYYYVTNIQGDVIAILNDAGEELVAYTYDAWGNVTVNSDMNQNLGNMNPLRYRGYVYDQETGLYYLQSRYYNPEIGRFISADKYISTGQGILGYNMFAYCGNNPVIRYDVSGEFFFTILGAVIGAVSGAIDAAIMGTDIGKGALAGLVSGAISGAGVDIGIAITAATGGAGVGAGLAVAGVLGAIGSAVGTGISTDWQAHPLDYAASALVGGMLNMISFGLAPMNGEIAKGTATTIVKSIIKEGFGDIGMNIATGGIIAVGATWIIRVITNNNQLTTGVS